MLEKVKLFFQESRRELSRVNWPTREETLRLTGVVIALSVAIAAFLGVFDYLFLKGVQAIVGTHPVSVEAPLPAGEGADFQLTPEDIEFSEEGDLNIEVVPPTN